MLALVAVLLIIIPAIAILYPFVHEFSTATSFEDEGVTNAELSQRWEVALDGLKNTELEWSLGNLAKDDYSSLRKQYMTDAATVMKEMELEEQDKKELLNVVELEVLQVRRSLVGGDDSKPELESTE